MVVKGRSTYHVTGGRKHRTTKESKLAASRVGNMRKKRATKKGSY